MEDHTIAPLKRLHHKTDNVLLLRCTIRCHVALINKYLSHIPELLPEINGCCKNKKNRRKKMLHGATDGNCSQMRLVSLFSGKMAFSSDGIQTNSRKIPGPINLIRFYSHQPFMMIPITLRLPTIPLKSNRTSIGVLFNETEEINERLEDWYGGLAKGTLYCKIYMVKKYFKNYTQSMIVPYLQGLTMIR